LGTCGYQKGTEPDRAELVASERSDERARIRQENDTPGQVVGQPAGGIGEDEVGEKSSIQERCLARKPGHDPQVRRGEVADEPTEAGHGQKPTDAVLGPSVRGHQTQSDERPAD
jgi:hypothetical protein